MTVDLRGTHPTRGLSLWQDGAGPPRPGLAGDRRADVVVIGAGFTGLWTALQLTERDPALDVVVLEAATVGHGASGRNGGFVEPSLTHGLHNGLAHFPDEVDELTRLGAANLRGLIEDVDRFAIDCDLHEAGVLDVATEGWQLDELAGAVDAHEAAGEKVELLDRAGARALVDSPTYVGALHRPEAGATVDPGRLVRGLAAELDRRGVPVHEGTPVTEVAEDATGVRVRTPDGTVRADRAVLATNAYSHRVLPRTARHFVPVHDYVLVTAPLTAEQRARVGWEGRQGVADAGNQFHYYRLTPDDRILWGGYDAIYRFGNGVGTRDDHRRATYDRLAAHFRATFPQLDDVPFERWWGGPIATTTRFTAVFGDVLGGRVVYALGYTGLGVAATRFAGHVLTDRLLDPSSPLLDLRFTSTAPFPFPPEPLRWVGVTLTRRALARADRRDGRRGPWLRVLDAAGIGFDS
ncbi:NAD(P)/FAD-dependent oxidoreductase [Nitriliruptor alkaliphilus]|uniref:NAD(P)/FAD-dependent oxidoreductase n=1 Tax=Nitriliruptor alkaliphilus TaxID=427918 RepID=UPI0006981A51|nr:FAD-dependent oxidoreductase [Nitriliruptor alkaliphilus]